MDNEIKTAAKILIASDIHLGCSEQDSLVPETERIKTFKRITSLAKEHDLFLIAGDLIDSGDVSIEIRNLIADEFRDIRAAGTEIIYTPGMAEQDENGELYEFIRDFGASHLFDEYKDVRPYSIEASGEQFQIYGGAPSETFNITSFKRADLPGYHIGLFHCDFKINKSDISMLNLDFYALGRGHSSKIFKSYNRIIGTKPGSPIAVTAKETGERYVVSMAVSGREIPYLERLPISSVNIFNLGINCGNILTEGDIESLLLEKASEQNILNIVLSGEYNFPIWESVENMKKHFFDIKVVNNAYPSVDFYIEKYENENTIRGEFFRILKERLSQNTQTRLSRSQISGILGALMKDNSNAVEEWLCDL